VAEAQGLVALASGEYVLKDDYGRTLFSLRNGNTHEAPTLRGELPYFTQITFALDVPRTPQPGQIFERMFTLALQFADVLHGEVVDDNKKLLTASGRKVIAETIHGITGEMQQRGVTPGSSVALRLYA
jgi:FtsZ-interacting cell division protein ZipA